MSSALYDRDFYEWTAEQARLLRSGRLSEADIENLAEEIESIGSSQKSEMRSRLGRILQHLLKCRYQPDLRSRSLTTTITVQRSELEALLETSPSLRRFLPDMLPRAYKLARLSALEETGLLKLPFECEWTLEQVVNNGFFPD